MNKVGTMGVILFILGICIADSKSIIPSIILICIGFMATLGSRPCEKRF